MVAGPVVPLVSRVAIEVDELIGRATQVDPPLFEEVGRGFARIGEGLQARGALGDGERGVASVKVGIVVGVLLERGWGGEHELGALALALKGFWPGLGGTPGGRGAAGERECEGTWGDGSEDGARAKSHLVGGGTNGVPGAWGATLGRSWGGAGARNLRTGAFSRQDGGLKGEYGCGDASRARRRGPILVQSVDGDVSACGRGQ